MKTHIRILTGCAMLAVGTGVALAQHQRGADHGGGYGHGHAAPSAHGSPGASWRGGYSSASPGRGYGYGTYPSSGYRPNGGPQYGYGRPSYAYDGWRSGHTYRYPGARSYGYSSGYYASGYYAPGYYAPGSYYRYPSYGSGYYTSYPSYGYAYYDSPVYVAPSYVAPTYVIAETIQLPPRQAMPPPPPAPLAQAAPAQPAPRAAQPAPQVRPQRLDRVTLSARELFDFDKAVLKSPQPKLDEIAVALGEFPQISSVHVIGYTDRLGSDAYNRRLSQKRADAVRDYLVGKGVEPKRLVAIGKGEADPIVNCPTMKRAELIKCLEPNRRVEVEQITVERLH